MISVTTRRTELPSTGTQATSSRTDHWRVILSPVGLWLELSSLRKQVCSLWWDSNLGSIRHLTAGRTSSSGSWDAGHTQSLTKKSGLVFGVRPVLRPPAFTNEVKHNCILSWFNSIYFTRMLKWLKEDPKSWHKSQFLVMTAICPIPEKDGET